MSKQLSSVIALASVAAAAGVVADAAPAVAKVPSKKSQALEIFQVKLTERKQGLYGSNKEFRAAVLVAIETELGVSRASASTMYNAAKVEAEAADATVALGRDPKKVKAPSTGKRGRPEGSKNRVKETVAPVAEDVQVAADTVVEPVAA